MASGWELPARHDLQLPFSLLQRAGLDRRPALYNSLQLSAWVVCSGPGGDSPAELDLTCVWDESEPVGSSGSLASSLQDPSIFEVTGAAHSESARCVGDVTPRASS